MPKNNNENNVGKVVTVGAGMAALAAAGYFFLGPKGKKNQRSTRAWMIKMKGDVVEKLESMQDITKETYDTLVDKVGVAYEAVADNRDEVAQLATELKSHWKSISQKAMQKRTARAPKRATVKRAQRKAPRRSSGK